jgi:hypothetical protein
LADSKPHIIVIESVGDDKVRLAVVIHPVRQIVGVAVRIVEKPTFLDDELTGVGADPPRVPAERPTAGHPGVNLDCLIYVFPPASSPKYW